jgi:hypothetical protein
MYIFLFWRGFVAEAVVRFCCFIAPFIRRAERTHGTLSFCVTGVLQASHASEAYPRACVALSLSP